MPRPSVRKRPGAATRALSTATINSTDQVVSLDIVDELDAIAAHVNGTFVIVVETLAGRYHRRCFLTANAAQKAAERATDRGENATVYLAELKPLWKLQGGAA